MHSSILLLKGIVRKVWRLMTFKLVDPVMQHGANKQLEFEDLLKLPVDMDPSVCHNMILRFWEAQRTINFNHPSLFKTICLAYGWPYFCIGLIKVTHCILPITLISAAIFALYCFSTFEINLSLSPLLKVHSEI